MTVLAAFLTLQNLNHVSFNNGEIAIQWADTGPFHDDLAAGRHQAEVTGNPATIEYNSRGAKITGASMSYTVMRQPDGSFRIQAADVSGNAEVTTDTAVQEKFEQGRGRNIHIPVQVRSHLTTDRLLVKGEDRTEILTVPSSFVLDGFRQAVNPAPRVPEPFKEEDRLQGASGTFELSAPDADTKPYADHGKAAHPAEKPENVTEIAGFQLRSGTIIGPARLHVVRTTYPQPKPVPGQPTPEPLPPVTVTYDFTADKIEFDFTQPKGTITATGHVRLQRKSNDIESDTTFDKVVLSLDENRKLLGLEGTGTPSRSTIQLPPGKGGR